MTQLDRALLEVNRPRFCACPFWGRKVGIMSKQIDPAVKARALRLVKEHRGRFSSLTAACQAVARLERIGVETSVGAVSRD